jgi:FkbM family methyltransferase
MLSNLSDVFQPAVFRQEDEEAVLAGHFANRIGGYFVEVGAYHPTILSQSKLLETRGWTGIMVEPLADQAKVLREQRTSNVAQVACGSPAQHGTTIQIGRLGGLSTLRADRLSEDRRYNTFETVQVVTLDSILEADQPPSIDFVSIDVEGGELDVLAGFDLARWKPGLLLIEDHIENDDIHRHMKRNAYRRVRRTGDNSWYVPNETPFPMSVFGRWQILRKYYLGRPLRALRTRKFRASLLADKT